MERIGAGLAAGMMAVAAGVLSGGAVACDGQAAADARPPSKILTDAVQRVKREQNLALQGASRQQLATLRSEAASALAQGGAVGDAARARAKP